MSDAKRQRHIHPLFKACDKIDVLEEAITRLEAELKTNSAEVAELYETLDNAHDDEMVKRVKSFLDKYDLDWNQTVEDEMKYDRRVDECDWYIDRVIVTVSSPIRRLDTQFISYDLYDILEAYDDQIMARFEDDQQRAFRPRPDVELAMRGLHIRMELKHEIKYCDAMGQKFASGSFTLNFGYTK